MSKTLVLGVGNLLLTDDGVGIHAIQRLQEIAELPEEVQVLDGGTTGLDLLYHLEGVSRLLIIDAVEIRQKPGTLKRLTGDEVPSYLSLKMSPHEIAIPDLLVAAKLRDLYPEEVVVWGVQPETIDVGVELSAVIAARLDEIVERVLEELENWGIVVRRLAVT